MSSSTGLAAAVCALLTLLRGGERRGLFFFIVFLRGKERRCRALFSCSLAVVRRRVRVCFCEGGWSLFVWCVRRSSDIISIYSSGVGWSMWVGFCASWG